MKIDDGNRIMITSMENKLSSLDRKILLTSSLTTARRFVFKMNLNGIKVVNYQTHTLSSLLRELLNNPTIRIVGSEESAYILLKLIESNDYGLSRSVKSIGASLKLLEVVNDYRLNENETFATLIKADYQSLLKDYKNYLDEHGLLDHITALTRIRHIRRNETLYLMSDVSLRPLEREVLKQVFEDRLIEDKDSIGHEIVVKDVYECYGQYGELLNVLNIIQNNRIPLGDVEVIYTDSIFENLIKGTCDARKIPYTLKKNHAKSLNVTSFINDILSYYEEDFKYELLEKILANQGLKPLYLEQFYKTLSFPKYIVGFSQERSFDFLKAYENDESVKDFYQLFSDLISVVNNNSLDYEKLLQVAFTYLSSKKEIEILSSSLDEIKYIVSHETALFKQIELIKRELNSLSYSEKDLKDHISFSPISRTVSLRKHIFVIGVNQNLLLGSDVENAFIKDVEEFKNDLKDDEGIHICEYQKKKTLENLIFLLSNSDADIHLSYSSDNKIDLRDMTEGVYLLDIKNLPEVTKVNAYDVRKNNYHFNNVNLDPVEEVEPEYDNGGFKELEGQIIKDGEEPSNEPEVIVEEEKKPFTLSPSALKDLMECPLRFYYAKIMGLTSIEYPSLDESEWLETNKKGTFFHRVMELYFQNFIKKDPAFNIQIFNRVFERAKKEAIEKNPISNEYITEQEINNLREKSVNYLSTIISKDIFALYKPLYNEKNLKGFGYCYPKCKSLFFSGEVDRIDGYVKDKVLHLRVVDYKTGAFKDKDKHGYYQHILYPYVLENALPKNELNLEYDKVEVDSFIYSYPFQEILKEHVYLRNEFDKDSNDYQQVMERIDDFVLPYLNDEKNYLHNIVTYFDENYIEGDMNNNDTTCKYCRFMKECIKSITGGFNGWKKVK